MAHCHVDAINCPLECFTDWKSGKPVSFIHREDYLWFFFLWEREIGIFSRELSSLDSVMYDQEKDIGLLSKIQYKIIIILYK